MDSAIPHIDISNALLIDGWMAEPELMFLGYLAKSSLLIVEAGCYQGRSTRALADNTKGIVYAVDTWDSLMPTEEGKSIALIDDNALHKFRKNLEDKTNVFIVRGQFEDFNCLFYPDLIFIDADHRYEVVKKHILKALSITKSGAIIAGHDYGVEPWSGVKQAVDELLPNNQVYWSTWTYVVP